MKQLANSADVCSKLNDNHISDEYYEHALKICNEFETKNMGQYHGLHLRTNILLLAGAFEKFRNIFIEFNGSRPRHYFSSPELS